jgi:hypothetical protein
LALGRVLLLARFSEGRFHPIVSSGMCRAKLIRIFMLHSARHAES